MDAQRFFPVPYDNRNDVKIVKLRTVYENAGYDGFAAYGRWVALLGILYDQHGIIDMSDSLNRQVIAKELCLDDVDEFFNMLAGLGLIDSELYHATNQVANKGVCDQLEFKHQKSLAAQKGNEKRWGSKKNRTSESH